jgi:L-2-hydroxyglutarate oxidase LhgO
VLEAESASGRRQTGRSSGVIHAGIYYRPGSLKARLCVEGSRALYAYCDERGLPYRKAGKLIVATTERELTGLDKLQRRGRANGVPGLRRLAGDEIGEVEPAARPRRTALAADRHRRLRADRRVLRGRRSRRGRHGPAGGQTSTRCRIPTCHSSVPT